MSMMSQCLCRTLNIHLHLALDPVLLGKYLERGIDALCLQAYGCAPFL